MSTNIYLQFKRWY